MEELMSLLKIAVVGYLGYVGICVVGFIIVMAIIYKQFKDF